MFAYSGAEKFKLLATYLPMLMSGVIPDAAQRTVWTRDITHEEMASRAGLASRATFTRRMSAFRKRLPGDEHSSPGPSVKKGQHRVVPIGTRVLPAPILEVIYRRRRFGVPNTYNSRLPWAQRTRPDMESLLEDPEFSDLFNPLKWEGCGGRRPPKELRHKFDEWMQKRMNKAGRPDSGFHGFKDVPCYLWSHRPEEMPYWWTEAMRKGVASLSDTARVVMTYYFACGLLDTRKGLDRAYGMVNPAQPKVAWCCGISIKGVYRANKELELAGLIRVAHPEPRKTPDGLRRGPCRILYLPLRQFTPEEAEAERTRFEHARHALLSRHDAARGLSWLKQATDIHSALLAAWTGKEHSPQAFLHELRRLLKETGMHTRHLRELAPSSADPP